MRSVVLRSSIDDGIAAPALIRVPARHMNRVSASIRGALVRDEAILGGQVAFWAVNPTRNGISQLARSSLGDGSEILVPSDNH
jgi:hypothetical protein